MNERITIASRVVGFAWAGRKWSGEPVVVEVVDNSDLDSDDDDGGEDLVRISVAQFVELKRQCQYPQYPLHIGQVDGEAEKADESRRELSGVQAAIATERKALDGLKAERAKTDKALAAARKRLKEAERKLQETRDALKAAETREQETESQQTEIQVEPKPDPDRQRN